MSRSAFDKSRGHRGSNAREIADQGQNDQDRDTDREPAHGVIRRAFSVQIQRPFHGMRQMDHVERIIGARQDESQAKPRFFP